MSYHHLVTRVKDIEERFESLISSTTCQETPQLMILRTQLGMWAVYSAVRPKYHDNRCGRFKVFDLDALWEYHKQNLLNYTDLNRNQFFIYGDQ